MSPFALWFFIGSIVAVAILITDFLIDKNNKQTLYRKFGTELEAPTLTSFCKIYYPLICTCSVILGPSAIYFYWLRTFNLKKSNIKNRI